MGLARVPSISCPVISQEPRGIPLEPGGRQGVGSQPRGAAQPGPVPPRGILLHREVPQTTFQGEVCLFLSLSSLFRVNMNKWQLSRGGSRVYPVDARQTMNLALPRWHRLSSKQINRAGAIETGPNAPSYSGSMVITAPPVTIWTHKLVFYL